MRENGPSLYRLYVFTRGLCKLTSDSLDFENSAPLGTLVAASKNSEGLDAVEVVQGASPAFA